ncbi:hypothetical protein PIB30_055296 [Stylosanthes scabra]|uniref:PB1-like domain-containing protein n=1 Tax=Stylosanthes scabra TaxID=79078 RepID=A0ABU6XJ89_9FABA|nr:hypothetical protein [Stylosanthes scabra]
MTNIPRSIGEPNASLALLMNSWTSTSVVSVAIWTSKATEGYMRPPYQEWREIEEPQRRARDDGSATGKQRSLQSAAAAKELGVRKSGVTFLYVRRVVLSCAGYCFIRVTMALFDINLFHKGYFGYVDGVMRYFGGEELIIEENDSDFWCVFEAEEQLVRLGHEKSDIAALWFKNPAIADLSIGLRMFLDDKNALEMVRIAAQRGHVELFVVHHDGPEERFLEIGYIDVGGDPPEGNGGDEQNAGGGDEALEPKVANDEGVAAEDPPNGQNEEGVVAEAPPNGQTEEGGAVATIDEGEVATSDVMAPLSEAGSGPSDAESILEGDQNAEGSCANEEGVMSEEDGGLEEVGDVNEGGTGAGIRTEDSDSDDAEYVPSADEVDSANDVHFTDSEEEFDLDESFFGLQTESAQNASNGKGKSVRPKAISASQPTKTS